MFPKISFSAEASDGEIQVEPSDKSEDELNLMDVETDTSTTELIRKAKEAGNPRTRSGADNPDPGKQAETNRKRKGAETVVDSAKSPRRNPKTDIFPAEIRPNTNGTGNK